MKPSQYYVLHLPDSFSSSCLQIDLQKMPLGKLSKRQIQGAYALLTEVQQVSDVSSSEGWPAFMLNSFFFFNNSDDLKSTLIPYLGCISDIL